MWFVFAILSIIFLLFNFYFVFLKSGKELKNQLVFILATYFCITMELAFSLVMVADFIAKKDIAAIYDVVPTLASVSFIYCLVIFSLNTYILYVYFKKKGL